MFRWSSSTLNTEQASDIIRLEELGTMSLDDLVWPVEHACIIFQHQLSTLSLNKNRAAVIIYYNMSIPSGFDLDCCSMHPSIMDMEKNVSVWHLKPCPWDLNLVIDWHTYNLSHKKFAEENVQKIQNMCNFWLKN